MAGGMDAHGEFPRNILSDFLHLHKLWRSAHFDQPSPQAPSHPQVASLLSAECPPAAHWIMEPDLLQTVQKSSAARVWEEVKRMRLSHTLQNDRFAGMLRNRERRLRRRGLGVVICCRSGHRVDDGESDDDGPDLEQTIDNYPFIDGGGGVHVQRSSTSVKLIDKSILQVWGKALHVCPDDVLDYLAEEIEKIEHLLRRRCVSRVAERR